MKTYKEMAERVLSRRDEYEERKQRRRKTAGAVSVSVFASLVLVVSMIIGPMFGTLLKKPAPASPVTDASSDETAETRSVSTEEQTDDITAETTETESGTTEPYIVIKNAYYNEDAYNDKLTRSFSVECVNDVDSDYVSKADMVGKKHGDVCVTCIEVTPYPENVNKSKKWVTLIIPDERTELLNTVDYFYFDAEENGNSIQRIILTYRFKDGKTSGSVNVYVFNEYYIEFFEENYKDEPSEINSERIAKLKKYSINKPIYFATIKGYDYWGYTWEMIYDNVARYYGDVDENGRPLFYKDPYMEAYCGSPWCEGEIHHLEELQKEEEREAAGETEAWELIDVSELSGYTVYAWDNDYGMNVLFGSKKTGMPDEDFHTVRGLIRDAYSGSVTKTFEYNGKSVELTYAGTKDSSLGDMGKISVYTYNDADFSEVVLGRRNEKYTSEVSFYENGEICEISGSLLGSVETDGGYDIEALKAAVMEKYGETFDFSRYEFSDTGEHRAADGKTVNGITYRWYNEKCGARVNDGIFITVLVNGSVSHIIYPSREYIKDLDVKFTFDELTAIINDKTEKALAERGYKRITPEEKDIYHAWWKFDVYRGKPAFYCEDAVYYVGGDNKFYPDGDTRTREVLVAYLIVIDNQ